MLSLIQAEIVGKAIGDGILQLVVKVLIGMAVIGGIALFLWLVRKVDKRINK
ncbi:MAG: hypothetical protein JNK51_06345 [Blastocatellia bacterium]|nr:hypothetical protein [Chloracidobacterium sp.]MBL8184526.1 hypothetical protein [Blastocatellia bacterium]HRJ87425.1 hypothetical protein [Pyrinomonadaceae bacterium]HRK49840.1 hypothetical protein [Pyrinomonadaceae bacterium]